MLNCVECVPLVLVSFVNFPFFKFTLNVCISLGSVPVPVINIFFPLSSKPKIPVTTQLKLVTCFMSFPSVAYWYKFINPSRSLNHKKLVLLLGKNTASCSGSVHLSLVSSNNVFIFLPVETL